MKPGPSRSWLPSPKCQSRPLVIDQAVTPSMKAPPVPGADLGDAQHFEVRGDVVPGPPFETLPEGEHRNAVDEAGAGRGIDHEVVGGEHAQTGERKRVIAVVGGEIAADQRARLGAGHHRRSKIGVPAEGCAGTEAVRRRA